MQRGYAPCGGNGGCLFTARSKPLSAMDVLGVVIVAVGQRGALVMAASPAIRGILRSVRVVY